MQHKKKTEPFGFSLSNLLLSETTVFLRVALRVQKDSGTGAISQDKGRHEMMLNLKKSSEKIYAFFTNTHTHYVV